MTTPRIEEMKQSFQELKRKSDNVLAINSPEQIAYCDALDEALPIVTKALTQAHQAGRDEAVEIIRDTPTATFAFADNNSYANIAQGQGSKSYSDGYSAGAVEMRRRLWQALDDTIKTLQANNKDV